VPFGDDQLMPGKLAAVFDVRRQLFRTITLTDHPHQNEKVLARDLVATVPVGSLILADLGYFGFKWFDDLTDGGYLWLSRLRGKTSTRTEHVFYQDETTCDGLVWLGRHRADRAKHLVRMVRFRVGATEHSYLTNVRDPELLPMPEIARLYGRRWDIELAVKLVKRDLGLHLLWSAKPTVLMHQIWAVLLIAQAVLAMQGMVADVAGVPVEEVSLALLVQYLPSYAAAHDDAITPFVADGRALGFIRPSRRIKHQAPTLTPEQLIPPLPDLVTTQKPRYANRKCGPATAVKTI
jgi:hypothetical protein